MEYGFEFDEAKSRVNKVKHGVDFFEAQDLWLDGDLLRLPARSDVEPRFLFIGRIGGVCWSAITTFRGESVRLISVRRSHPREVQAYEGE
jgi:uncharacterized DUF497 family protein